MAAQLSPITKVRGVHRLGVLLLANLTLCLLSAQGDGGPPAGWSVSAPDFDASLQHLSNGQLIERLPDLDMSRLNLPRDPKPGVGFAVLDNWVDLSAPDSAIRIRSPELRELIHRGAAALPTLLEHVTDPRPSHLAFVVPRLRSVDQPRTVKLLDVYDSRKAPTKGADGVNTGTRESLAVDKGYSVKVGDLCYVAIGQIVNRKLFIFSYTGSDFDEQGRYKSSWVLNGRPFGFDFVESPVMTPALAAAVRSDWQNLEPQALAASLRADIDAKRGDAGAFCRLMVYAPANGREKVHAELQHVISEPGEVTYWSLSRTLSALEPFWWDELGSDLKALLLKAAEQDRRFQSFDDTRKNPLASGTADAVSTCASLLANRGGDSQLRATLADEIKRLRQERTDFGGSFPVAYDYQIGRCEAALNHLNGELDKQPLSNLELTPVPAPPGVTVTVAAVEPTGLRWPMMRLRFGVSGLAQSELAAARIVIETARDDTGFDLAPGGTPSFVHSAVGRANDAVLSANEPPSLDVTLNAPPGLAQRLVKLQGSVELVVPRFDPNAIVTIPRAAATAGARINSSALAAAGVAVTLFTAEASNQALAGASKTEDGPQSYGAQPHFRGSIPKGLPARFFQEPSVTDSDLPLGIDDPSGRIVAIEFVAADGSPLHYDHNGWYHSSGAGGRRFDVYRLEQKDIADATLVLTLATGKALVRIPFDFSDVALPEKLQ